jgi:glyoxylase-like metal-dependent hydrolase (beta-lactamase superfamily II)
MQHTRILTINFQRDGQLVTVHPALVGGQLLVDCGFPGQLPSLMAVAEQAGYNLANLVTAMATHHDWDHIGCLAAIKARYSHVQIAASAADAPMIEGRSKSLRLEQTERLEPALPADQQAASRARRAALAAVETVKVDRILRDGDVIGPGGARVVATPGHMPGHLAVFVEDDGLLIAGDALTAVDGELRPPNPLYTLDMPTAIASLKRLLSLPIQRILCYHGGLVEGDVKAALAALVDGDLGLR